MIILKRAKSLSLRKVINDKKLFCTSFSCFFREELQNWKHEDMHERHCVTKWKTTRTGKDFPQKIWSGLCWVFKVPVFLLPYYEYSKSWDWNCPLQVCWIHDLFLYTVIYFCEYYFSEWFSCTLMWKGWDTVQMRNGKLGRSYGACWMTWLTR